MSDEAAFLRALQANPAEATAKRVAFSDAKLSDAGTATHTPLA